MCLKLTVLHFDEQAVSPEPNWGGTLVDIRVGNCGVEAHFDSECIPIQRLAVICSEHSHSRFKAHEPPPIFGERLLRR